MKKLNFKSRKGFTLIELLVVIGILAVLAAIAIPSVAGLIDRANVSADKTNSNEMTNAMERFASEYELFCQDIASGTLDTNNLDAAQGRVYNVLGIDDRAGIELIEIDADEIVGEDVVAIYRDTKYPANAKTAQLIVQNYTKTSSSTFEPKQSDMHYWYSPDCGVIVFAEANADTDIEKFLNSQIQSGQDAKGNSLDANTQWIDITTYNNAIVSVGSVTFTDGVTLSWSELKKPENISKYKYNINAITSTQIGDYAFFDCNIKSVTIPNGITKIGDNAFYLCNELEEIIFPSSLKATGNGTFDQCLELKTVIIPEGFETIGTQSFYGCASLESITLPSSLKKIENTAFCESYNFTTIVFNGTKEQWNNIIFEYGWHSDTSLSEIKCSNGSIEIS